jgi:hypothetical protein
LFEQVVERSVLPGVVFKALIAPCRLNRHALPAGDCRDEGNVPEPPELREVVALHIHRERKR